MTAVWCTARGWLMGYGISTLHRLWYLVVSLRATSHMSQEPPPPKKKLLGLELRDGFLLNPSLNTSPKPHLQRMLPCSHPCHSWDLGLGNLCEVVSPNFHALNDRDCTDWPQVTWESMWTGPKGASTHEPKSRDHKNCESPQQKWPKAVPPHLQTHAAWSRTLKYSVKLNVTAPSTECYFNEFLFTRVLVHDRIE